jgi:formimidoylglutamate deiminase
MIDYRQRLVTNQRNTFEGDAAAYLVNEEILSGRKAMGNNYKDHFAIGQSFDAVIFNSESHLVANTSERNLLATLLYTSDSSRVMGTIVNGKWIVKNQHHVAGYEVKVKFNKAMQQLKTR